MAIHHASSGELISVRPYGDDLAGVITKALYKSRHLEVFRMVLLAGKEMPPHQVAGDCSIQCIEGSVVFTTSGNSQLMRGGDLLCLEGGLIHALKAVEDASLLVTIVLHRPACGP